MISPDIAESLSTRPRRPEFLGWYARMAILMFSTTECENAHNIKLAVAAKLIELEADEMSFHSG